MNQVQISKIYSNLPARGIKRITKFDAKDYRKLPKIGIQLDHGAFKTLRPMAVAHGMDSIQPSITTASIGTPIQFLQTWVPGFVKVMTAPRKIDELVGRMTVGVWEHEQIVMSLLERLGNVQPYGDYTNVPLSSFNNNFITRTIIRLEMGMRVGKLETARSALMMINNSGIKREAAALVLDIARNSIGFNGFNSGANLTYGFLNDPGEGSYGAIPNGASGSPLWSSKTYDEIQKDILTSFAALRNLSLGVVDPKSVKTTLALPTAVVDYLARTSIYGNSVQQWLTEAYPLCRVVDAPQLNAANGGQNVFYLYADKIEDDSTDDGQVFLQAVPTQFMVLGVQQLAKGYEEDYSNATAGVTCKRPAGMVRYTNI